MNIIKQIKDRPHYWVLGALVLIIGIWSLSTLDPPPEDLLETSSFGEIDEDLEALKAQLEQEIEDLTDSGFITVFQKASHEVWVNPAIWDSLAYEEKEGRVRVLSQYLKSRDGTSQVVVRADGTDEMVADFFANELRIK
jgi:hypothetical protein